MSSLMIQLLAFVGGAKKHLESEKGATAVEYGLLVALIAAVIIVIVATLGTQVNAAFTAVSSELP